MFPGGHPADRPAVTFAPSGATLTYGVLDAMANRVGRMLRAAGLRPGDHIALCVENSPAFYAIAWGAHYAGLIYTACSTSLTAEELSYIVTDCGASAFFLSHRFAEKAPEIADSIPGVDLRIAVGGAIDGYEDFEALAAGHEPTAWETPRPPGRDMLYSSGTTGRPKGITTSAIESDATLEETPSILTQILIAIGMNADTVYLSPAPLYHAAPLRFTIGVHQLGGHCIVMEKWDAALALELIERERVTAAQFVPTMFIRMLRLPEDVRAAADVSSIKLAIHAAAPCPVEVKRQMLDWWGPVIHEYYSGTEGGGLTWVTPEQWLEKPGTVGKSIVGVPHIMGPDDEELPVGQDGAVYFSDGPEFEYHNDPDKTAAITNERGWQTFGDIGHVDEDGFLYLTDRASYMIISGGVNVYPQETEDVLQTHPKVLDAAVFGIPHPDMGEVVHAVVQPVTMPATEDEAAALEAELVEHCARHLAPLKRPRTIELRGELPRTETGKLLKRLLKDEYAQQSA